MPTPGEEVHLRAWRHARGTCRTGGARAALAAHQPGIRDEAAAGGRAPGRSSSSRGCGGTARAAGLHLGEFTMLEWYRPGAVMASLMDETEAFLRAMLPPCHLPRRHQDLRGSSGSRVADAFARWVGADVLATEGTRRRSPRQAGARAAGGERLGGPVLPPAARAGRAASRPRSPTFLTHWPAAQAALARRDPADPRLALRFELFVCGIELANAFEELTDAASRRHASGTTGPGARRCTGQAGRWMTTSWRRSGTACRLRPGSRWVSTGWRCSPPGPTGSSRCFGCRSSECNRACNLGGSFVFSPT